MLSIIGLKRMGEKNMTENTLQEQWSAVCNRIRKESSDGVFIRWLEQITPTCAEAGAVAFLGGESAAARRVGGGADGRRAV